MSTTTRDERILVVTNALAQDVTEDAIFPEEGRRRGYTGQTRWEGCASGDNGKCPVTEWASCTCFLQACAVVAALEALESGDSGDAT